MAADTPKLCSDLQDRSCRESIYVNLPSLYIVHLKCR